MNVKFQTGSIIYKPRCGHGEQEWFNLVCYLNAASFRPKLRAARVACRDGYCWMEEVKFAPCKDQAAAHRFYKRLGGTIAAAYILKAVDCHRDNMIAAGEHPVLIDAETLWHAIGTQSLLELLYETGFLPSSGRRSSYQYRSSALGLTAPGKHTPHIAAMPLRAARYEGEIVNGFRRAWRCLLGTNARRAVFIRRVRRLQRKERRRIYRSTPEYDRIMRSSVQPTAMRSEPYRNLFIARSFGRSGFSRKIIREEVNALKRLDIPYFSRRATVTSVLPVDNVAPAELINAIRRALQL